MTDEERANERFVATDAINYGKSQCMDCGLFDSMDFACKKLKRGEDYKYATNEEKCPFKEK
jgi:hypothetical protein